MNVNALHRYAMIDVTQTRQRVFDRANIEPVVIKDGFTDYVLMTKSEYESLMKKPVPPPRIGPPDIAILAAALAKMARTNVR